LINFTSEAQIRYCAETEKCLKSRTSENSLSTCIHKYYDVFLLPYVPHAIMLSPTDGRQFMPRTSPFEIKLSRKEREVLQQRAAKYTSPYCEVIRAKIILLAAEGTQNNHIAQCLSLPFQIV